MTVRALKTEQIDDTNYHNLTIVLFFYFLFFTFFTLFPISVSDLSDSRRRITHRILHRKSGFRSSHISVGQLHISYFYYRLPQTILFLNYVRPEISIFSIVSAVIYVLFIYF